MEAFAAVEEAYSAFNYGDDTWVEIRDRGSAYDQPIHQELLEKHLVALFVATQAADAHLEVVGCESHGLATWPDVAGAGPIDGYEFTCDAVRTDSFHGPAGMQLDESFVWVVSDREVLAVTSESDYDPWADYTQQFYFWLADTHPDVAAEMTFVEWQAKRAFPSIVGLPIALEYVDEFVAAQK